MDYYIWLDEKPKEAAKPREEQKMKNELPTTDSLLIVKVPYFLKQTSRRELWERLLLMKQSGVVVLDASTEVLVVPKDIEVHLEAPANEIEKNENSEDKEESET